MGKKSAGILMYRVRAHTEVYLVHPGGPFFRNKDAGAWTIPKGEFTTEDPLEAAKRECMEEVGIIPEGNYKKLRPITQRGGKTVYAWAVEGEFQPRPQQSNTFELEWPPRSGRIQEFPEIDKGRWMDLTTAKQKINPAQADFLDELLDYFFEM